MESDVFRLNKSIAQLIKNSVVFNQEPVYNHIGLSAGKRGNDWRLKLLTMDDGVGIDESIIDRATEMFFRGSSLSKGSDVGLYVVKSTIQALGGTVSIAKYIN